MRSPEISGDLPYGILCLPLSVLISCETDRRHSPGLSYPVGIEPDEMKDDRRPSLYAPPSRTMCDAGQ